jgi:hypothetical protein
VVDEIVTIVAGLPRSGTSMMMKMLEAGGMSVLTDRERTADVDNPKGYYEYERVKQIEEDVEWLEDARGRVVKMVSALLLHLPNDYAYKVIFMERSLDEVLASQRKMLVHRGEPTDKVDDVQMKALFGQHLDKVRGWLAAQPNVETIYVSYNEILEQPTAQVTRVNAFLGGVLDEEAMVQVVDPSLYRNRQRADE